MSDEYISDLIPGYALDCLDEAESLQVDRHLATCATCRAEWGAYQRLIDQLGMAVSDVTCAGDLKNRLMARVLSAPPLSAPPLCAPPLSTGMAPPLSWWQSMVDTVRRTAPTWGLVSVALVVVLLISNTLLLQRVEPPSVMVTITLSGTEAYPEAVGMIVVGVHGDDGALVVDNLELLDAQHQYQLWLIKGEERTNGGVFSVDEDGYAVLWVESAEPLVGFESFGITVEPAGGSLGPTGDKVLGDSL